MLLNYKVKTSKKNKFYSARFHYLHISVNFYYLLMPQTYIIGEIGQNHNGSVDIAKLIVDLVARPVK